MEKIIITKTTEEVIDQPHVALENLQHELKNIKAERERLDKLEAEIVANIDLITKATKGYIVNVTEAGKKAIVHKAGEKGVELDVHRGDKAFTSEDEAKRYAEQVEVNAKETKE